MKIEENLELFNKLKEEFKKKYGTQEIKLPKPFVLDVDSMTGTSFLSKLRINPDTDEFEWWKEYWDYGWYPERMTKEFNKTFADVWFEVLCQILECWKVTVYYLPNGEEIYRTEEEVNNG